MSVYNIASSMYAVQITLKSLDISLWVDQNKSVQADQMIQIFRSAWTGITQTDVSITEQLGPLPNIFCDLACVWGGGLWLARLE